MRNGQRAFGMLLVLLGLLFNPFVLSFLFSNDGNIGSPIILTAVFAVECLMVLSGIMVYRTEKEWPLNVALAVITAFFSLLVAVGADRLYGAFFMPENDDILFPAFSVAKQKTSEFELNVRINNLGFRGPNAQVSKTKKRVVLIGDSFTFGWGVELEQTWVHQLSEKFPDIEFLNLGQGGNHPGDHVRVAKTVLPLLKPDLIMVCILQGNDLHQLMRMVEFEEAGRQTQPISSKGETGLEMLRRHLGIIFPNFSKRFPATTHIQERWKLDAEHLLSQLTDVQKEKYRTIPAELRSDLELGLLNPSLIFESVHHPKMFFESADTALPLCQKGIIRLHDHLLELENLAADNGSDLLFVSLPNRPYGFPETKRQLSELGFDLSGADTLNANLPIELAVKSLGSILISPTIPADQGPVFFSYDGHWNENGNRIFAAQLISVLEQGHTWKHFLTSSDF